MSATPPDPARAPGPVAQALQRLLAGRLVGWMAVPFALLGAAGLAVSWTNLSTFVGYERLKKAATAEARARVSELYFEVLPPGAVGPRIGGQTEPAIRVA